MTKIKALVAAEWKQFMVLSTIILGVVGMTGVLNFSNPFLFQRFISEINPIAAILLSGILGMLSLSYLLSKGWFSIYKKENLKGSFRYAWLVVVFASIAIFIDWEIVYPADMNIPFPESLLFYPVMGFFVEMLFHVLPLTVLLFLLTSIFKNTNREKLMWLCIVIVAMLEPVYQILFMESFPTWAITAVGIYLFLFNLTQLFIFKKFNFVSMYLFRLIYYLIWHIGWGYFRLELLF
jgi:hypothetical protein